jgi:hypothetical protein
VTSRWPLRRIVFWAVIVGIAAWIISNPAHAGNQVQHAADSVLVFLNDLTK